MRVVAFLQNQWFKNPEWARNALAKQYNGDREKFIKTFLFYRCVTGKRLEAALGALVDEIAWENCSPEIGGQSASRFPADTAHMRRVIEKHQPEFVIAFGRVAEAGLAELITSDDSWQVFLAPHPAARGNDVMPRLKLLASELSDALTDPVTPPRP